MALSSFSIGGIKDTLNVSHNQRCVFAALDENGTLLNNVPPQPLASLSFDNIFLPTTNAFSQTDIEWRNSVFAGYRFRHKTTSDDLSANKSWGKFTLQAVKDSGSTEVDILEVDNDNKLTFKVPLVFDFPLPGALTYPNNNLLFLDGTGIWKDPLQVNAPTESYSINLNINNISPKQLYVRFKNNDVLKTAIGYDAGLNKTFINSYNTDGITLATAGSLLALLDGGNSFSGTSDTYNLALDMNITTGNVFYDLKRQGASQAVFGHKTGANLANTYAYLLSRTNQLRIGINSQETAQTLIMNPSVVKVNGTAQDFSFIVNTTNTSGSPYLMLSKSLDPEDVIPVAQFGYNSFENSTFIRAYSDYFRLNIQNNEVIRVISAGTSSSIGRVGINTINPQAGLHINDGVGTTEKSCLRLTSSSTATKLEIENTSTLGRTYDLKSLSDGTAQFVDRTSAALRQEFLTTGAVSIPNVLYYGKQCAFLYLTGPSSLNPVGTTTWYKLPGTSASLLFAGYNSLVSNRISYTGVRSTIANVTLSFSVSNSANSNRDVNFTLYKNNVEITGARRFVTFTTANQYINITIVISLLLTANDYIEPFFNAINGTGIMTFNDMAFNIT